MLTSIYTKTLRGYWIPILGWGLGLALVLYGTLSAFATQFSHPRRGMNSSGSPMLSGSSRSRST